MPCTASQSMRTVFCGSRNTSDWYSSTLIPSVGAPNFLPIPAAPPAARQSASAPAPARIRTSVFMHSPSLFIIRFFDCRDAPRRWPGLPAVPAGACVSCSASHIMRSFCLRSFQVMHRYHIAIRTIDRTQGHLPADVVGQEHGLAQAVRAPAFGEPDTEVRGGEREAGDGHPELHVPFARPPQRTRSAAARERHADPEDEAAEQAPQPEAVPDERLPVLEIRPLEVGEPGGADDDCDGHRTGGVRVSGHERLAERAHEAEAGALHDDADGQPEHHQSGPRRVVEAVVEERERRSDRQHPDTGQGLQPAPGLPTGRRSRCGRVGSASPAGRGSSPPRPAA